jgi:hypothetical protein
MVAMSMFPTSTSAAEAQAPLGPEPSYDDVLDVAVQYTFPCSDPIAVQECCGGAIARREAEREEGAPKGPGQTSGHGEALEL